MQGRVVVFTAGALCKFLHWKRESTVPTFPCHSWFHRLLSFPSITNFSWLESHSLTDPSHMGAAVTSGQPSRLSLALLLCHALVKMRERLHAVIGMQVAHGLCVVVLWY